MPDQNCHLGPSGAEHRPMTVPVASAMLCALMLDQHTQFTLDWQYVQNILLSAILQVFDNAQLQQALTVAGKVEEIEQVGTPLAVEADGCDRFIVAGQIGQRTAQFCLESVRDRPGTDRVFKRKAAFPPGADDPDCCRLVLHQMLYYSAPINERGR